MNVMNDVVHTWRAPWLLKVLGVRWRDGKSSFRMTWGELNFGRPGWAFALCLFSEHYSLHLHAVRCNLFVDLPILQGWHREPFEMMESWGASCVDGAMHFTWGRHTKIVSLPWRDWVQTAHDVRLADGSWEPFVGSWERDSHKEPDRRHQEAFPYRYVLNSGEVQNVTATIYIERRTRKLRWLRRLPFGRTTHAIDVRFSDEVGERSGSWKGGTVGCAYELRADETPRECLRRMQRERKFT